MKPGVTALLLVDLQRDYLDRPNLAPTEDALIARSTRILEGFREAGAPVAHIRTEVRGDGSDAMPHWSGRLQCVAGTPGAAPPPSLAEQPGELVATKQHYRGFADPKLDPWLRARGVSRVVIAGLYAHACVRETALDAYERGYEVIIAEDAIGTDDPVHAERTRAWLAGRAAQFRSVEEILADGIVRTSEFPATTTTNPADDVGTAVDAQRRWAESALPVRVALLERWADRLEQRTAELAACLVEEIAKPQRAAEDEVSRAIAHIRTAASLARSGVLDDEVVAPGVQVRHRPVGVVAAILPWNNPMALASGKVAPAVACGNAVVVKPAPEGARSTRIVIAELSAAGAPEGLVAMVSGGPEAGAALVADPRVDAITVTGSIRTGRSIAVQCARRGIPLQAELGGNNAAIVLADADLADVVPALVRNAVAYAGQRCTAIRRFVVVEAVVDEFMARAAAEYAALRLGEPADPATDVGPVISTAAATRIQRIIDDALASGARVVARAELPPALAERGPFVAPVLLQVDDPQAVIVHEETFGPVAVIQTAADAAHAIDLANAVEQGLVHLVCTQDRDAAREVLDQLDAGITQWGPGIVPIHADAPFGGWKASGLGPPEHGRWDAQFFTRPQTVYDLS